MFEGYIELLRGVGSRRVRGHRGVHGSAHGRRIGHHGRRRVGRSSFSFLAFAGGQANHGAQEDYGEQFFHFLTVVFKV